jgi:alcohol dehydrogenase class IV
LRPGARLLESVGVSCCHGYALVEGGESLFSVDVSALSFGPGAIGEAGELLAGAGVRRAVLFTDAWVRALEPVAVACASLEASGIEVVIYDAVEVEPTKASFQAAAAFARHGRFDGYLSVGGGSVIDTCKAAALYATHPADFETYVNAPIGEGRPVPGPLPPHIACPTTCGTGSEHTGIAIFDDTDRAVKTGIASRHLRPWRALVDPRCTRTLPAEVVAASGFDVLCHALESYTARPFTARARPASAAGRPMSQGRNPWSDLGSLEALRLGGRYLVRAVHDATDTEAREALSWAATLAGIAFGNAGVHLPHAMSYAVAGQVESWRSAGYPGDGAMVPHGISVVVNAPSVFRAIADTSPDRHLQAAAALGADPRGAAPADAGALLAAALIEAMRATGIPNGIGGLGYGEPHLAALAAGAVAQKRLVDNAPRAVDDAAVRDLFRGALSYW